MSWVAAMFTSSLGRKYVMSLTGLFLCLFLVVHLGINLLTMVPDGGNLFNVVAHFMSRNLLIRIMEIVLFAGILIHIIQSVLITRKNQQARPVRYAVTAGNSNSPWVSRNMGILGSLIFIFLIIHMRTFYYESRFGKLDEVIIDGKSYLNLYAVVVETFALLPYALLYFLAMFALGFHLWHGFHSAFRSLGIRHNKYTPAIVWFGRIYTIVITAGFMLLPLYWYLVQH